MPEGPPNNTAGVRAAEALLSEGKISIVQFNALVEKDRRYHQHMTPAKAQSAAAGTTTTHGRKKKRKFHHTATATTTGVREFFKENEEYAMNAREKKEIYGRWGVDYEPQDEAPASSLVPYTGDQPLSREPLAPVVSKKADDAFHLILSEASAPPKKRGRPFSPPASVQKVEAKVLKDFQTELHDAESELVYLRDNFAKAKDLAERLEVDAVVRGLVSELEMQALQDEHRTTTLAMRTLRDETRTMELGAQALRDENGKAKLEVQTLREENARLHSAAQEASKQIPAICEAEPLTGVPSVMELGSRFDRLQQKYCSSPMKAGSASASTSTSVSALTSVSKARRWSLKQPLTPTSIQKEVFRLGSSSTSSSSSSSSSSSGMADSADPQQMQLLRSRFYSEIQSLREELYNQVDGGDRLKRKSDQLIAANEELAAKEKQAERLREELVRAKQQLFDAQSKCAELETTRRRLADAEAKGEQLQAAAEELKQCRAELKQTKQQLEVARRTQEEHVGRVAKLSAREVRKAKELLELKAAFLAGVEVMKHGRKGKPRKRLLKLRPSGNSFVMVWGDGPSQGRMMTSMAGKEKGEMALAEIQGVQTGQSTAVLQRSGQPQRAGLYLSLMTADRSLDLELGSIVQREQLERLMGYLLGEEARLHASARTGAPQQQQQRQHNRSDPHRAAATLATATAMEGAVAAE
eukprot:g2344.t1